MPKSQADLFDDLAAFLGSRPSIDQARQHISTVTEFVKAYTRGNGIDVSGDANDDLAAVVVTASARLLASPSMVSRKEIGSMSLLYTPFTGFTVAELVVLNRYRQRTA